jgi:tRNA-Thr(GGU) m(6)t(6)A37 methyltransferase TsaA
MQPNDATRRISLDPIGVMHSPFGEKFGTPRQAGLVDAAIGEVELFRPYSDPRMFAGLEGFSHLWLTFRFDRCVDQGWHARVRPPRLGGNVDVGVWASRAPFRPNHLGLSAVRLLEVLRGTETRLRVAGIDLIDGTPILDIKPYLPYADCIADACGGFAAEAPPARFDVVFSQAAERGLAGLGNADALRRLIVDVIALDPRPAYRRGAEPQRRYGMRLGDCDVAWRVLAEDRAEVIALTPVA